MVQNLQNWADSYTDNFAFYIRDIVNRRDIEKINDFLKTARNDSRILYIVVLNKYGTPIAKYDPGNIYKDTFLDKEEVDEPLMQYIEQDGGRGHYRFIRAIHAFQSTTPADSIKTTGFLDNPLLFLGISPVSMQQRMNSWIKQAILIIGALLLIFITISVIYVDRASLPLRALTAASSAIGKGDLSYHVKSRAKDEIGLVAESFNKMVDQLKESREQIQKYTDNLEHEIEKRTADLKQSELKYRTLFEHSGNALALVGVDNSLIMVNHQFRRLSGLDDTHVSQITDFVDLFEPEDRDWIYEIMIAVREKNDSEIPINCESFLISGDNTHKRVNLNFSLLPNTVILLVNMADVTQIRELQTQLDRAQHLVDVGEMSASLAHEIRNPLGAINASIDVLEQSLDLQGDESTLFKIIGEETMRVNRIITDFLHFARIQKAEPELVQVNDLLKKQVEKIQTEYGDHYLIDMILEADLNEIEADSNQISFVIKSILENAVEAMPAGGEIKVSSQTVQNYMGNDQIYFDIEDSGPGFEQDKLIKIFQPFFTTKEKGIGMGMAISERIIQNHNGIIKLQNIKGKGLGVSIVLPV